MRFPDKCCSQCQAYDHCVMRDGCCIECEFYVSTGACGYSDSEQERRREYEEFPRFPLKAGQASPNGMSSGNRRSK